MKTIKGFVDIEVEGDADQRSVIIRQVEGEEIDAVIVSILGVEALVAAIRQEALDVAKEIESR